jgi:hypothetical protein
MTSTNPTAALFGSLRITAACLAASLATFVAAHSTAGIASLQGDIEMIDPPDSVQLGALESNTTMRVFLEKTNFVLPSAIQVDILGAGRADMDNRNTPPTPGQIPAGTRVDVFLIHHDQLGDTEGTLFGQVGTDTDILGVIHSDNLLDNSDAVLGVDSTLYPNGLALRGMVVDPTEGDFEFVDVLNTPNGVRRIDVNSAVGEVLDQVRVITAAGVPEPSGLLLALLGVTGVLASWWPVRMSQC